MFGMIGAKKAKEELRKDVTRVVGRSQITKGYQVCSPVKRRDNIINII